MDVRNLVPRSPARRQPSRLAGQGLEPLFGLQRDVNRIFDDFWARFNGALDGTGAGFPAFGPRTDVAETDEAFEVAVELPGMDEKDLDVAVSDNVLTIRGEKKAEKEDKDRGYYLSERSYGAFHRDIPLPAGVDGDKAKAEYVRGVLTVTLPKTPETREKSKKIKVKAG